MDDQRTDRPRGRSMIAESELKELRKNQRLSRKAIPILAGFFVASAIMLWGLSHFLYIPQWVVAMILGISAFTLVGDIVNYLYCDRKLRRIERETI